jgi:pimeloyl-ACP methyl ester carboxylesterase
MHFIRRGRGTPVLVFVHGFCCSHADWQPQLDFFSPTNEVVACDLRGHGDTPGRPQECSIEHYGGDVAALVNNLELSNAILIGHSMGTRVILEAARLVPKKIQGLVLVDGSRSASGDPDTAEATAKTFVEKNGYPAFAENLFRQMFFKSSAEADAIVARALTRPAEMGATLWTRMARWDASQIEPALAAVRCPVLAIQSTTRDAKLNRSPLKAGQTTPYLDLLREKLRQVRIEVVPDTGHFTMLEEPETVNRLIREFAAAGR